MQEPLRSRWLIGAVNWVRQRKRSKQTKHTDCPVIVGYIYFLLGSSALIDVNHIIAINPNTFTVFSPFPGRIPFGVL